MVWKEVCAILVRPPICKMSAPVLCGKLHVCVDLHFWLALLPFSLFFLGSWSLPVCFLQFCMVLPSFLHSLPRLNGLERGVCHLSAPPICKMYVPVLCGKFHVCVDLQFWLALLHFSWFFLGPWSPPVCFLQLCMVLPSFLHSLPRLNGLERGVCHLSVPPFARCMHLSCVESSMYVLTFTFGLRCFIFHVFFVCPGVLPCVFYNFAWFCLHFCIVFPD